MKTKLFEEAIKNVKNSNGGKGRNTAWHIINGSSAYKEIFNVLIKMVMRERTQYIYKQDLLRKTRLPSSAAQYPLYMLERDDLIMIKKKIIYIQEYQKENWEVLCAILGKMKK